ncbi:MAG TPA: hypothetical protein VHX65_01715 [Pirellulales bacterium]|jgi:hypothetical protein|nr:hypothetical protein [Pirellulales bacterium]
MSGESANESEPPRDALDPMLLDRLVDGELAEAERRTLLRSLDRQPSGWRQCALAFLEAQSWRELLGAAAVEKPIAAEPVAAEKPIAAITKTAAASGGTDAVAIESAERHSVRPRRALPRKWLWMAEMAASFLVAFSLGIWIRGGLTTTAGRTQSPIVSAVPGSAASQTLQVVAEGGNGKVEQMQVPLVDNSRLQWWQSQPAAVVPEEVRQAIERAGGQVRQERKYFPVQLLDGRRVLVPIDQIELVPAGNRGMQ